MLENDKHFIFHSWLTAYQASGFAQNIRMSVYFPNHHDVIEKLLEKSTCEVACNIDDKDQVYGYIIYDGHEKHSILHWIYVKSAFRDLGIGKLLFSPLKDKKIYVTHLPEKRPRYCEECYERMVSGQYGRKLTQKIGATYNPYLIWEDAT